MTKKVDIRLLQEAQATIGQLQAKLSGESFVSHEHYSALQLERDQLAARVVELEEVRKRWAGTAINDAVFIMDVIKVLNGTPAASLARHDAEVLRKFADKTLPQQVDVLEHYNCAVAQQVARKEADRIEQGNDDEK